MNSTEKIPKLISFNKWLSAIGVTDTTGWRWRKKGIIKTINIYGRLYVSEESISDFIGRAENGEFAMNLKPGKKVAREKTH
jgi:predicted site-specific integrase-resolvase